eukprot:gene1497-4655_t
MASIISHLTGGLGQLYGRIKEQSLLDQDMQGLVSSHEFDYMTAEDGSFRPVPPGVPLIGQRYRYVRSIGRGGFALLVQAEDTFCPHRKHVAIKIMHAQYYELGKHEAEFTQKINAFDTFDTFTFGQHFCITFELLSATQLKHAVETASQFTTTKIARPGALKVQAIRKIAAQLLSALALLRHVNVIHADLKPDNVLLRDDSATSCFLKVADFGNAIDNTEESVTQYYDTFDIQTPLYRAPEVYFGIPFGVEIDMWSTGCILLELYMNGPPFAGTSPEDIISKIADIFGPFPAVYRSGKFSNKFRNFLTKTSPPDVNADRRHATLAARLQQKLGFNNASLSSFLAGMLDPSPTARITPEEALRHPFLAPLFPFRLFDINYPLQYDSSIWIPSRMRQFQPISNLRLHGQIQKEHVFCRSPSHFFPLSRHQQFSLQEISRLSPEVVEHFSRHSHASTAFSADDLWLLKRGRPHKPAISSPIRQNHSFQTSCTESPLLLNNDVRGSAIHVNESEALGSRPGNFSEQQQGAYHLQRNTAVHKWQSNMKYLTPSPVRSLTSKIGGSDVSVGSRNQKLGNGTDCHVSTATSQPNEYLQERTTEKSQKLLSSSNGKAMILLDPVQKQEIDTIQPSYEPPVTPSLYQIRHGDGLQTNQLCFAKTKLKHDTLLKHSQVSNAEIGCISKLETTNCDVAGHDNAIAYHKEQKSSFAHETSKKEFAHSILRLTSHKEETETNHEVISNRRSFSEDSKLEMKVAADTKDNLICCGDVHSNVLGRNVQVDTKVQQLPTKDWQQNTGDEKKAKTTMKEKKKKRLEVDSNRQEESRTKTLHNFEYAQQTLPCTLINSNSSINDERNSLLAHKWPNTKLSTQSNLYLLASGNHTDAQHSHEINDQSTLSNHHLKRTQNTANASPNSSHQPKTKKSKQSSTSKPFKRSGPLQTKLIGQSTSLDFSKKKKTSPFDASPSSPETQLMFHLSHDYSKDETGSKASSKDSSPRRRQSKSRRSLSSTATEFDHKHALSPHEPVKFPSPKNSRLGLSDDTRSAKSISSLKNKCSIGTEETSSLQLNRPDCQDYVVLDFSSQERFNQNRSQSRFQVDEQLSSEDEIDLLTL